MTLTGTIYPMSKEDLELAIRGLADAIERNRTATATANTKLVRDAVSAGITSSSLRKPANGAQGIDPRAFDHVEQPTNGYNGLQGNGYSTRDDIDRASIKPVGSGFSIGTGIFVGIGVCSGLLLIISAIVTAFIKVNFG